MSNITTDDFSATEIIISDKNLIKESSLGAGSRVKHPRFGEGTVISLQDGEQPKIQIKFDSSDCKTLVMKYARLVEI